MQPHIKVILATVIASSASTALLIFTLAGSRPNGNPAWGGKEHATIAHVRMPRQGTNGIAIKSGVLRVGLIPGCLSCAAKSLPRDWATGIETKADALIVFDTEAIATKHLRGLSLVKLPIIFAPLPEGIPLQLEELAPCVAIVGRNGDINGYGSF